WSCRSWCWRTRSATRPRTSTTRSRTRCATPRRWRGCAPRSTTPRASRPASTAAASGWEADMLAAHVRSAVLAADLTRTPTKFWWGAVMGGFVIVRAVAALPTLLVVFVQRIDRRVVGVKATLKAAQANTADTALIAQTADGVEAVLAEGLEHHLFLGRVLG